MNIGTTGCTEAIMEDNGIMCMARAIIRKFLKMSEQFIPRAVSKLHRGFTPNSSRSLTEEMHIRALSLLPNPDLDPDPNHNHLNEFYETQDLRSLNWSYWVY